MVGPVNQAFGASIEMKKVYENYVQNFQQSLAFSAIRRGDKKFGLSRILSFLN